MKPIIKILVSLLILSETGCAQEEYSESPILTDHNIDISELRLNATTFHSITKNKVVYDFYFNQHPEHAAIYVANLGLQFELENEKHEDILNDLIDRRFAVVVVDMSSMVFSNKYSMESSVIDITENSKLFLESSQILLEDYFILKPGFSVELDVPYFQYSQVPEKLKRFIAKRHNKEFNSNHDTIKASMDIVYSKFMPTPVIANFGSSEHHHQPFTATNKRHLIMSIALKNFAVVNCDYWDDPYANYLFQQSNSFTYYGIQFSMNWSQRLKSLSHRYNLDSSNIIVFGHSKGSDLPAKLSVIHDLRINEVAYDSVPGFSDLSLSDRTLKLDYGELSSEVKMTIFGAGVGNYIFKNPSYSPITNEMSDFIIYSDHKKGMVLATEDVRARMDDLSSHPNYLVLFEDSHDWPNGANYKYISDFIDKNIQIE